MKNIYKFGGNTCCFLLAVLMAGCTSSTSYNKAMERNAKKLGDSKRLEDAHFLVDAASYNILATKMAEQAIKSGYSASIVSMAKENYEQHVDMGKELKKLARKEKIVLPAEMSEVHQTKLAQLASSDRREFDRAYVRILREISEEDSRHFAEMATKGESDDVRAFAARKLDMFKSYETELQTVDAELLRTY